MKKPEFIGKWSVSLKNRAKKLKSEIPAIFLALKDKETPLAAKIFAAATVVLCPARGAYMGACNLVHS